MQEGRLHTLKSDFGFLNLINNNQFDSTPLINFIEHHASTNFSTDVSPIYFVGDGATLYQNFLENLKFASNKKVLIAKENQCNLSSISIAKVGYTNFKNGNYGNSNILQPIYLRKSQAELALEEKKNI